MVIYNESTYTVYVFLKFFTLCHSRESGNPEKNGLLGDLSERVPPDPISNSEVKTFSADDSMVIFHVKVGHCQAFYL